MHGPRFGAQALASPLVIAMLAGAPAFAQCPEAALLAAPDAAPDESFGAALALDGVRLAVGLPRDAVAGLSRRLSAAL